jgi:hypothetical protein
MPSQDEDAERGKDGAIDQFVVDPAAQHPGPRIPTTERVRRHAAR